MPVVSKKSIVSQESVRMLREIGYKQYLHFGMLRNEIFWSVGPTESVNEVLEAIVVDVVYFQVIKSTPFVRRFLQTEEIESDLNSPTCGGVKEVATRDAVGVLAGKSRGGKHPLCVRFITVGKVAV